MRTQPSFRFALVAGLSLANALFAGPPARGDPPPAGWAVPDLVDTAYVRGAVSRGAILWDVRGARDFETGHLPGAASVGAVGEALRDPSREDPLPPAAADTILGRAGIDIAGKEVIAYGRKGDASAHYAALLARHYGGRRVRVFHGGLDDWQSGGYPLETGPGALPPVVLRLTARKDVLAWTLDVLRARGRRDVQIIDVRTPKEYRGEDVRAIRGGHIPGAVNIPYERNWVDPEAGVKLAAKQVSNRDGMGLRPVAELRRLYADLDPGKETVVYCQSGARAALTAGVLRALGFGKVRVYEPSWLGYAGTLDAPAEDEVFFNVGAMSGRIAALQSRIAELEAQVEELRRKLPRGQ